MTSISHGDENLLNSCQKRHGRSIALVQVYLIRFLADLPSLGYILYISEQSLGNHKLKTVIGAQENTGLGLCVCSRIDRLVGV